jgi:hypothetical protein
MVDFSAHCLEPLVLLQQGLQRLLQCALLPRRPLVMRRLLPLFPILLRLLVLLFQVLPRLRRNRLLLPLPQTRHC